MTSYGQFCPVALGAEIFAERWTPLIVRELLPGGLSFGDIHRGVPRISKNLLAQRLVALQHNGIIEHVHEEGERRHLYRLTQAGRAFAPVVDALGTWGYEWACKDLTDENLDPDFLMWTLRRLVRRAALPDERVVVTFRFRRFDERLYWLVLERHEVDLCLHDPGFEVSLEVEGTVASLARVCLGQAELRQLLRSGEVEVHGAPRLRRALPNWLGVTRFAALAAQGAAPH